MCWPIGTGVFGYGIGEMARQVGAEVEVVGFPYDSVLDPEPVRAAARRFRPRLVTAVHCETPSGTLNPLYEVGQICREVDALYYVDFVASAGGVPVDVDANQIDLGLLGSQKVLSLMPDLAMVSVSDRAWAAVAEVNYAGYDALGPWRTGVADRYLPYTHNWQAMAGLQVALDLLLAEGLENVYRRHAAGGRALSSWAGGPGHPPLPGPGGVQLAHRDGRPRAGWLGLAGLRRRAAGARHGRRRQLRSPGR